MEQRDPLGNSRLIAPDAAGRPVGFTDALGSVIALTREDQSVLTSYAYSPYGQSQTSGAEEGNASQYTAREAKSSVSSSSVRRPRAAASSAVARPVAPPPTTSTS